MADKSMKIPAELRDAYYDNRYDPKWKPPSGLASIIRWCRGCKQWKTLYRSFRVHKTVRDGKKHYRKLCNACLGEPDNVEFPDIDSSTPGSAFMPVSNGFVDKPLPLFDMLPENAVKQFLAACVRHGKENVLKWLDEKFESRLPGMLDNV